MPPKKDSLAEEFAVMSPSCIPKHSPCSIDPVAGDGPATAEPSCGTQSDFWSWDSGDVVTVLVWAFLEFLKHLIPSAAVAAARRPRRRHA